MPRIFADTQSTNKLGYAMGYCGSGVSFAAFSGMRLAQRMMGQENFDTTLPLYSSPLPSFPFPAFRTIVAVSVSTSLSAAAARSANAHFQQQSFKALIATLRFAFVGTVP